MAASGEPRGLGGEIKFFPPLQCSRKTEKWEDLSWQLKSYVALYKPVAGEVVSTIEGSPHQACTDQVVSDFKDRRQLPHQLVEFSRQLHYLLAQITEGPARLIVRLNEAANGFESWRQLHARFALPDRARGVSLLGQLLEFKFRDAHFEPDLTEFLSLKSRHENQQAIARRFVGHHDDE